MIFFCTAVSGQVPFRAQSGQTACACTCAISRRAGRMTAQLLLITESRLTNCLQFREMELLTDSYSREISKQ